MSDWSEGNVTMPPDFDWAGALRTAGQAVSGVVQTAGNLWTARQNIKNQQSLNAVNLRRAELNNALELTQAQGAVDIAKARASAEVSKIMGGGFIQSPAGFSIGSVLLIVALVVVGRKYL